MLRCPNRRRIKTLWAATERAREQLVSSILAPRDQAALLLDGAYDVARVIEIGGIDIDRAIAHEFGVDEHVADQYKRSNFENSQTSEAVRGVYQSIAVEIGRALNFYGFNNPNTTIEAAYCCGGGSLLVPLVEAVADHADIRVSSITDVLPSSKVAAEETIRCPAAIGAT